MNKKKIILIAALAAVAVGGSLWLFSGSSAKHKVSLQLLHIVAVH